MRKLMGFLLVLATTMAPAMAVNVHTSINFVGNGTFTENLYMGGEGKSVWITSIGGIEISGKNMNLEYLSTKDFDTLSGATVIDISAKSLKFDCGYSIPTMDGGKVKRMFGIYDTVDANDVKMNYLAYLDLANYTGGRNVVLSTDGEMSAYFSCGYDQENISYSHDFKVEGDMNDSQLICADGFVNFTVSGFVMFNTTRGSEPSFDGYLLDSLEIPRINWSVSTNINVISYNDSNIIDIDKIVEVECNKYYQDVEIKGVFDPNATPIFEEIYSFEIPTIFLE